jgi:hypothetical protein
MAGTKNSRLMRDMKARAALDPSRPAFNDVSPEQALQETLDRAYSWMIYWATVADKLSIEDRWRSTINGKIPHEAIRAEAEYRQEVAYLAARALDLGIAERQVALNERTAAALVGVLDQAMDAAGLNKDQRRALGAGLREAIEGTATERPELTAAA